ncbi:MAG: zinc-binding dehydrogenase [Acidimicrobiales bacterium]|nr:zinc-binding dehydrogenase [Acidimicrobiales bacterium]
MQAARVIDGELQITEVDVPEPGPDQARVRITSAGVCHSDLHLVKGHWFGMQIPEVGHEAIGIVEELGPGAERFTAVGDRVILGLGGTGGGYWCGACIHCLGGEPRLCDQGSGIMGTFAEQFCVYAKSLVTLPPSIGDEEAPLACGGLTAYGAVKKLTKHSIGPGSTVGVIGAAGGLGHYAVQLLKAFGYKVVGVDLGEEKLTFVKELGADQAVEPAEAAAIGEAGGVDAVLVFTAVKAGFDLAITMLRKGGLFVAVGIPPTSEGNIEINPMIFFSKAITMIYSGVGTVQDMRELVALSADGKVKSHIGRQGPLSELPAIFEELESGAYVGRAVITDLGA